MFKKVKTKLETLGLYYIPPLHIKIKVIYIIYIKFRSIFTHTDILQVG